MNVLDLFSGIGGFSLGLERAGMRTIAFCEINPYCQRVLRKYWPDVPIFDDVRALTWVDRNANNQNEHGRAVDDETRHRLPEPSSIDVICGGFPCQDISVAGKGAGIEGSRSGLWSEYARIVGEVRPRYVIVENVAALLGRGLGRVLGDLAALGYDAEWHCIPASAVGAPHRRDRVWIVAYAANDIRRPFSGSMAASKSGEGGETQSRRLRQRNGPAWHDGFAAGREYVANAIGPELERRISGRLSECLGEWTAGAGDTSTICNTRRDAPQRGGSDQRATGKSDWWLAEPDVGRVASRLSDGLDGGLSAHESCLTKARTKGVPQTNRLRFLRGHLAATEASSRPSRCAFCGHPLSSLSCEGGCSPWAMGPWAEEDQNVRCLREGIPELLTQSGQDLQQIMPIGSWQAEREQAVGKRVDRLRVLGNAIVPQIPEIIGRAIIRKMHK